MQKLGFPSMKILRNQMKSLSGAAEGTAKTFSFSSRSVPDSASSEGFVDLKIAAEKLVKEEASLKTDPNMANTKLRKTVEHAHIENGNAKLKVKQKEDEKLWNGLESKFSSTKTLCDKLTETLQHLACQVQEAEKDKEVLVAKISASSIAVDGFNQEIHNLSLKVESAEETIRNIVKRSWRSSKLREENCKLYRDEQQRIANLIEEKGVSTAADISDFCRKTTPAR